MFKALEGEIYASGVSLDSDQNIYLTGSFEDGADIGGNLYYSLNGNHNLFVAKYNTLGNCEWVYTVVGFDEIHGNAIHINSNNTMELLVNLSK